MSGHGCFRSFFKRFGHDTEDGCPECGSGIAEDAQYVLFECRRFSYDRQILMETTGARVRPETFAPLMLLKEVNWEATAAYAASVLRTLRRTDNERREASAYHCVKQYLAVIPRNHGPLLLFLYILLLCI